MPLHHVQTGKFQIGYFKRQKLVEITEVETGDTQV